MESSQTPPALASSGLLDAARESVAARLGVSGDFIRVPQLARALGLSSNSIHAQMRLGTFPVPHRRVGNVIVVKLDDYVAWFASDGKKPGAEAPAPIVAANELLASETRALRPHDETPKQRMDRLRDKVCEAMARDKLAAKARGPETGCEELRTSPTRAHKPRSS